MIALCCRNSPEVVEKIDCIVLAKRRASPDTTYSRARFLKDAVDRAVADFEVLLPKVRTRQREPVKPVSLGRNA